MINCRVWFVGQYGIAGFNNVFIISQVYGKSHEIPDVLEEGEVLIPDVKEFRRKLTETY